MIVFPKLLLEVIGKLSSAVLSKCFSFRWIAEQAETAHSCFHSQYPSEIITRSLIYVTCSLMCVPIHTACEIQFFKIHTALLWWRCANVSCYLTSVNSFMKTLDKRHLTKLTVKPMFISDSTQNMEQAVWYTPLWPRRIQKTCSLLHPSRFKARIPVHANRHRDKTVCKLLQSEYMTVR